MDSRYLPLVKVYYTRSRKKKYNTIKYIYFRLGIKNFLLFIVKRNQLNLEKSKNVVMPYRTLRQDTNI